MDLEAVNRKIEEAKQVQTDLENEVAALRRRQQELDLDEEQLQRQKALMQGELQQRELETDAGQAFMQLIANLRNALADPSWTKKGEVERICAEENFIQKIFDKFHDKDIWPRLSGESLPEDQTISKEKLHALRIWLNSSKALIAGETHAAACDRLKRVVRDSLYFPKPELLSELGPDGKEIKRAKLRGTNLSSSQVQKEVKKLVEENLSQGCRGLRINEKGMLFCDVNGVGSIEELPPRLKQLLHEELRLKLKNHTSLPDERPEMQTKFEKAVSVINSLSIPFTDVVSRCVDEIEVVCCKFVFDEPLLYPGVHLTINAKDGQCLQGAEVNLSGKSGGSFTHKTALHGKELREGRAPAGKPGSDGCHGQDGQHGGHVTLKFTNKIKDYHFLEKNIATNGGNGGEAQLGGNGDEGKKGKDGVAFIFPMSDPKVVETPRNAVKRPMLGVFEVNLLLQDGRDGTAPDTSGMGSGQTCIGWGQAGEVGGPGGAPGRTGLPGRPGSGGQILVEHGEDWNFTIFSQRGFIGVDIL